MKTYNNLDEVKADLIAGIKIYWANKSYGVHFVENQEIRVSCISNYFGSLLGKNEATACFSLGETGKHEFGV